jgi:hypothetical protein
MGTLIGGLFIVALAISCLAFWIYALVSAIKNENLDSSMRLVWVLVIIFVSGLGALLYLIIAPNRPNKHDRSWAEWHERQRKLQGRGT